MNNPNTDFENVMAMAALNIAPEARQHAFMSRIILSGAGVSKSRGDRLAEIALLLGISLVTSVILVAETMPSGVDAGQTWTHSLISLSIAQSMMLAGASFKVLSRLERYRNVFTKSSAAASRTKVKGPRKAAKAKAEPGVAAAPAVPTASGLLSGRTYLALSDGSVEIETLLGRRRFINLDAAREFVGE